MADAMTSSPWPLPTLSRHCGRPYDLHAYFCTLMFKVNYCTEQVLVTVPSSLGLITKRRVQIPCTLKNKRANLF